MDRDGRRRTGDVTTGAGSRGAGRTGGGRTAAGRSGAAKAGAAKAGAAKAGARPARERATGRPDRAGDERRGTRRRDRAGRTAAQGGVQVVRPLGPVVAGLIWVAALVAAAVTASAAVAVLMVPVAAIATASGLRSAQPPGSRRGRRSGPMAAVPVIAGLAVAVIAPLAAIAGPGPGVAVLVVLGAVAAATAATPALSTSVRPVGGALRAAAAAVVPATAATSLVIARHQGTTLALALIGATAAYDAAAFVMGHGRSPLGGPVGVVSGVVAVAVVAVFVAAVMNPPFSGNRPWVVMGAVAVLAPLGVRLGTAVAGRGRLPALRRLDSLFVAGPVWALFVSFYLHR